MIRAVSRVCLHLQQYQSNKDLEKCFITKAAWLSTEMNIHCLTSIVILVLKGQLPPYALNIHLFSSQPCESTFRSARSLNGTQSSITNFSVSQFMKKIEKISILNTMKSEVESIDSKDSLKFPTHHKNRRSDPSMTTSDLNPSALTIKEIETIVLEAYHRAEFIVKDLQLTEVLREGRLNGLSKMSAFVFQRLSKTSKATRIPAVNDPDDEGETSDDSTTDDDASASQLTGSDTDPTDEDPHSIVTKKQSFQGMRIYDHVNPSEINQYLEIDINNKSKYIHKQTAARLLTTKKHRLSSDRLSRVKQANKQS
jgi:hypothetical protein